MTVRSRVEVEFGEDAAGAGFDGLFTDVQLVGDRPIGSTLGERCEDLALSRGQGAQPLIVAPAPEQVLDDLRVAPRSGDARSRFIRVTGSPV